MKQSPPSFCRDGSRPENCQIRRWRGRAPSHVHPNRLNAPVRNSAKTDSHICEFTCDLSTCESGKPSENCRHLPDDLGINSVNQVLYFGPDMGVQR